MEERKMEIEYLEECFSSLLGCDISFKNKNIKDKLKKEICNKFQETSKLQDTLDEIVEIKNFCISGIFQSGNNEDVFENLCNSENIILSEEIENAISRDMLILHTIVVSDVMVEYFKEEIPNLEKIVIAYKKMKDEDIDVSYFDISKSMNEVLRSYYIEDMSSDEIFELINSELENFIKNDENYKNYIDKI